MAPRTLSLGELSAAFARRSSGGVILFAGPGGTGKTLAAETLANRLRLDFHRIDLSKVVSKYIGETEKNLERVLAAAESRDALLFFDEADTLFGRGTESEADYLLRRLRSSKGVAILSTEKRTLKLALSQRFTHLVRFPQTP
jgi:SpoVK/Ycf46/Vps4 family AAA+-type ATPase